MEPSDHAVLDTQARAANERRARDLAEDVAEAESHADLARAERLRLEFDALVAELERATGLGGRSRSFAGPAKRARTAVRKALKRVLDEVEAGDQIAWSVRTAPGPATALAAAGRPGA